VKKPIYSNDRKAPRMRKAKFSKRVVTKDLWKAFTKQFVEYKKMSWEEFFNHWKEIAKTIREEAITNPLGVKLGSYMGELKLQYTPHKMKVQDHKSSLEMGEQVDYLNLTMKGKVPTIKWERRWAVKYNKILQYYAFDETREMNIKAHEYVPNNYDKIRISRNTLGGISIWRQKMNKK
jgi:hypothetical protein